MLGLESRSLENPAIPISSAALTDLYVGPRTHAGVYVNEQSAQRIIAVYRAWALIAGSIGSLPIRVFRGDPPGRSVWAGDQASLLQYPGGRDETTGLAIPGSVTAMVFYETLFVHLLTWGNAYVVKVPNEARSRVVRLDLLAPSKVMPRWGRQSAANPTGKEFLVDDGKGGQLATPADVIHIRAMGPNLLIGLSPIGAARQALGLAVAAEEYGARLFGSGSLMAGILQTDARLDQSQADRLKAAWESRMAGLANAHRVAVLDSGAKFQPIGIPPNDAQFIDSRKFQVLEIARLYGIPPHMLGDVERSTSWGTGIEQQGLAFNIYTLRPWLTRVEQALSNELLPRGVNCQFDVTEMTRGDIETRLRANQTGVLSGQLTPNEARSYEGRPPIDGGDKLLFPMNYKPLTAFSDEPEPPAAPPAAPHLEPPADAPDDSKPTNPEPKGTA